MKAEQNLSPKQKAKLLQAKTALPLFEIMHSLKEEFHNFFENSCGWTEGTLGLIDWLKKAEPYYSARKSFVN
jgi:transposase